MPLQRLHLIIAPITVERRLQRLGPIRQRPRRFTPTKDTGPPGSQNPRLLAGDGLQVRAQPIGMIQVHGGDQRHIGIEQIDRIQAPPQPHLHHRHLHLVAMEDIDGRQGAELKIGQRGVGPLLIDAGEGVTDLGIIHRLPVDADTFVIAQQMGGAVGTDPIARRHQHGLDQRLSGAFAIGTGQGDEREWGLGLIAEARQHLAHALQAEIDLARM